MRPRSLLAVLSIALGSACALAQVAGPVLPDAPNPPRPRRTPFEFPNPDPSGTRPPFPTPAPGATLPPAPRDGHLARTGPNYLEFLVDTQHGKTVFFAFPYDSRLAGVRAAISEGSATLAIAGSESKMTPFLDDDGNLFFYVFPRLTGGSQPITITATVKGVSYAGSYEYP